MRTLTAGFQALPSGYRAILGVLFAVLVVVLIGSLLGEREVTVAELRHVWRPDLGSLARLHRSNPMFRPGDLPEIEQRFGSLRLDLREEMAHLEMGGKTWSGTWQPTPPSGSAPAILVRWASGSLVGRSTSFSREHGMLVLTMDAVALPLIREEEP